MRVHFGKRTVTQLGQPGSHIQIHTSDYGWDGAYEISCHGLSPEETAAKISAIGEYHRKKAAHLDRFREEVWGFDFDVDLPESSPWRVVDCCIWERGTNVQIHIGAYPVIDNDSIDETRRISIDLVVPTIDDVPVTEDIIDAARTKITELATDGGSHDAFVAEVAAALQSDEEINVVPATGRA